MKAILFFTNSRICWLLGEKRRYKESNFKWKLDRENTQLIEFLRSLSDSQTRGDLETEISGTIALDRINFDLFVRGKIPNKNFSIPRFVYLLLQRGLFRLTDNLGLYCCN